MSPGALAEAMRVLRDWRNGAEHMIDPGLFDLLRGVRAGLERRRRFRSSRVPVAGHQPMLHDHSGEVAAKSQHLLGKALDIRVEGVDLGRLHRAALACRKSAGSAITRHRTLSTSTWGRCAGGTEPSSVSRRRMPERAVSAPGPGSKRRLRRQRGVDDVDHAVGLKHVGGRGDPSGHAALGVGQDRPHGRPC